MRTGTARVAASGTEVDPDGVRMPAGEVHAWEPGHNQTACGLALSRSRLLRFPHVAWPDVQPDTGGHADYVQLVCRRCAAATGRPSRQPPVDADRSAPLTRATPAAAGRLTTWGLHPARKSGSATASLGSQISCVDRAA